MTGKKQRELPGQTKRLEILVVEDTPDHIDAARQQLSRRHNIEVAKTYCGAIKKLKARRYDVVLTDLFFPWNTKVDYPLNDDGDTRRKEDATMPQAFGYPLAMIAVATGVPYVGIVTDANHHSGAMAATTDELALSPEGYCRLIPGENVPQLRVFTSAHKNWSYALGMLINPQEFEQAELERRREYDRDLQSLPDYKTLFKKR